MSLRIGSCCTGYGGLDGAVQSLLGGELAWVADIDEGASKILAHRFPGIPNLGDISAVDWSQVGPVDILCGGFPCTDVSQAGQRAGLTHGTRSGVWHHMARAIAELRPGLVFIENVRGLLTARGDEPTDEHVAAEASVRACDRLLEWVANEHNIAIKKGDTGRARKCASRTARIMGARKRAVARCQWHERRLVRAIGTVLGSLASLGFDAEWCRLSASDAGSCHGRDRIFILAWPAAADPPGAGSWRGGGSGAARASRSEPDDGSLGPAADPIGDELQRRGVAGVLAGEERATSRARHQRERDGDATGDCGQDAADPCGAGREGPGPAVAPGRPLAAGRASQDADGATGHQRRLPAPGQAQSGRPRADTGGPGRAPAADAPGDGRHQGRTESAGIVGRPDAAVRGDALADPDGDGLPRGQERDGRPEAGQFASSGNDADGRVLDWGIYEAAVRRWEATLGRPAPAPTVPGRGGKPRLNPALPEWMMGLPEGWVTDVPGLSRNDMLRALGNGVVPQCAIAAYSLLLPAWLEAVRAGEAA